MILRLYNGGVVWEGVFGGKGRLIMGYKEDK